MQKLPEAPDRKRGDVCAKKELSRQIKEARPLSAVISGVTTPKSFLLLVKGAMRLSLDDALANLSTCSSCLFYQRPKTKTPNNGFVRITIKTPYNGLNDKHILTP